MARGRAGNTLWMEINIHLVDVPVYSYVLLSYSRGLMTSGIDRWTDLSIGRDRRTAVCDPETLPLMGSPTSDSCTEVDDRSPDHGYVLKMEINLHSEDLGNEGRSTRAQGLQTAGRSFPNLNPSGKSVRVGCLGL